MNRAGILSFFLMVAPAVAQAEALPGPVPADLIRAVDGDTLELRVRIWLDQELIVKARLADVDAPELSRPACDAERTLAQRAKDLIADAAGGGALVLTGVEHDKYAGRVVARVSANGADLSEVLLRSGLAVPYGEDRDWCAARSGAEG